MDTSHQQPPALGLQFFGRITSATTHELNNIIGIINEHAGLLEDLVMMAAQKNAPESGTEQYAQICQKISAQVHRAKSVIKNLNHFAHSVDNDMAMINPDTMIDWTVSLSGRMLAQKNIKIIFEPNENDLKIMTRPFEFMNAVYLCLMFAADNVQKDNTVCIECRCAKDSPDICVHFSGLLLKDSTCFPDSEDQLLNRLEAKIKFSDGQLCLIIPETKNRSEISG